MTILLCRSEGQFSGNSVQTNRWEHRKTLQWRCWFGRSQPPQWRWKYGGRNNTTLHFTHTQKLRIDYTVMPSKTFFVHSVCKWKLPETLLCSATSLQHTAMLNCISNMLCTHSTYQQQSHVTSHQQNYKWWQVTVDVVTSHIEHLWNTGQRNFVTLPVILFSNSKTDRTLTSGNIQEMCLTKIKQMKN